MQFLYLKESGAPRLKIEGEEFHYLFKVRRTKSEELPLFRNLEDGKLYRYKAVEIAKRHADLELLEAKEEEKIPRAFFHLLWAVVDAKTIEKSLPMLNELGVGKISFFYARYSQRDIRLDMERLGRILIHSCEQSGRTRLPVIECFKNLEELLECYSDFGVMDFGGEILQPKVCQAIMVGPEGGFSQEEREKLVGQKRYSSGENLILKSETAALFALARSI